MRGVRADKTLDALSSPSAWFGPSLLPGKPSNSPLEVDFICPFVVLDPTDLGATIVVAPGQMPGDFLPSPDADCLLFFSKASPSSQPLTHARQCNRDVRLRLGELSKTHTIFQLMLSSMYTNPLLSASPAFKPQQVGACRTPCINSAST